MTGTSSNSRTFISVPLLCEILSSLECFPLRSYLADRRRLFPFVLSPRIRPLLFRKAMRKWVFGGSIITGPSLPRVTYPLTAQAFPLGPPT